MPNSIWEGVFRYPSNTNDVNFTLRSSSYGATFKNLTLQSAGAIMLASAGGTVVGWAKTLTGAGSFEMTLLVQ